MPTPSRPTPRSGLSSTAFLTAQSLLSRLISRSETITQVRIHSPIALTLARSIALALTLAPLALQPRPTVAQTCTSPACQSLLDLEAAIDPASPLPPAPDRPRLTFPPTAPASAREALTLDSPGDRPSPCPTALDPDLAQTFATSFAHNYSTGEAFVPTAATIAALSNLTAAYCQQAQTIAALTPLLGSPIGYKVAATSAPVQQLLGLDQPVVGRLFSAQLLPDRVTLSVQSGARLIYEADLLVQVADSAINQAQTPLEVAENLELVVPFLEVADLTVGESVAMTGPLLAAVNGGARWGVLGRGTTVERAEEVATALEQMRIEVVSRPVGQVDELGQVGDGSDASNQNDVGSEIGTSSVNNANNPKSMAETGQILVEAPGTAILGHPLRSVLVLRDHLQSQGQQLKAGDWISLGSFGRFIPATANTQAEVRYFGFPGGDRSVTVQFSP
ncbi:MAG: hypothetical protein VKK80_10885 [Prochlorothrix sp.]|nr:hypothetical protein [Prochlorothrix sp.]